MPDNFDPTTLENPVATQAFLYLLNRVESLAPQVQSLQQENQALRDEVARLHLLLESAPSHQPNSATDPSTSQSLGSRPAGLDKAQPTLQWPWLVKSGATAMAAARLVCKISLRK